MFPFYGWVCRVVLLSLVGGGVSGVRGENMLVGVGVLSLFVS